MAFGPMTAHTPPCPQPGIPKNPGTCGPGALHGDVSLTLNTRQALQLVRGRRRSPDKPAITGLMGFAHHLKLIWQASGEDDPYADWWLIKIETAIERCRTHLRQRFDQLATLLDDEPYLDVSIGTSVTPQTVSLQFATPQAFRAAQCLGDLDRVVCLRLTLQHVGVAIPTALRTASENAGKPLRGVFGLPHGYYYAEINRADVRQCNQRAQNAIARMGAVPDDIVQGNRLPRFRPGRFATPDPGPDITSTHSVPSGPAAGDAVKHTHSEPG
jgi:integrating conjugative element protein (TIGR03761 family)